MKQFQIAYQNDESLCRELESIKQWCAANPSYVTLFRIYSEDMDLEHIKHVCDILDAQMPDSMYMGCTSYANLLHGAYERAHIILTCTVFEYESSRLKVLQYPFTEAQVKDTVGQLRAFCEDNPWVKCVEMNATILGMSLRDFCEEMSDLPHGIQVYGGGAYAPNMDTDVTYVFSKGNGFTDQGIIFLALGGSDFHVKSTYVAGWKPLTREYTVTKAIGAALYELDGESAFGIYQKYLNIDVSRDNFISNTVEFPLYMDYKGVPVLRCAMGLNKDESLMMATETPEGSKVRIAYGNPEMILSDIRRDGQKLADFQPDVVHAFSCSARKTFWGDENVSDETLLFNSFAPTSGMYVSGEFLRIDDDMRNFNITLVLAAMREGEPKGGQITNIYDTRLDSIESEERTPLTRRFISFIEAITKELEETNGRLADANSKLEDVNRQLAIASITDGLTKLYNRAEIEKRIRSTVEERTKQGTLGDLSLIMLDIDNFKRVNDVYGHKEGDRVIIALSDVLREVIGGMAHVAVGRWGGEEFMVMLPDVKIEEALALAEKIRLQFSAVKYEIAGCQTVSLGVTHARVGESADTLYTRVDKALYIAKYNGRNRTVKLEREEL